MDNLEGIRAWEDRSQLAESRKRGHKLLLPKSSPAFVLNQRRVKKNIARGAAKTLWIGEAFQAGRWYTLWTTARLYAKEAQEAVEEHPARNQAATKEMRIVKFARAAEPSQPEGMEKSK